jgi:hypothetical protein
MKPPLLTSSGSVLGLPSAVTSQPGRQQGHRSRPVDPDDEMKGWWECFGRRLGVGRPLGAHRRNGTTIPGNRTAELLGARFRPPDVAGRYRYEPVDAGQLERWLRMALRLYTGGDDSDVGAAGRLNCKAAPAGRFASAQRVPPWAPTMDRQIDKPIPMPLVFVVWKGLKISSRRSGAMPGPESRTATRIFPSAAAFVLIDNSRRASLFDVIASTAFITG